MNGVVFQTSAMMITANELNRSPNQALSSAISGRLLTKPVSGVNANCQAKAATTVTIPYGIRTEVRSTPRPKIARCIDERDQHAEGQLDRDRDDRDEQGVENVLPPQRRGQDGLVVREPGEAALLREAQVELLQREDDRVDDRVGGDQQHRDHRGRAEHPAKLALGSSLVSRRSTVAARPHDAASLAVGSQRSPSRLTACWT